jgi:large subunit ribosomal protein L25
VEKVALKASHRTVIGKQVHALRRAGELPGILYGYKIDPTPITLNAHDARLVLSRLTSSSLVTVNLDGKDYPTLVRERQRNFIKGNLLHVDFQVVSLTEKIHANVSIELTGISTAVKDFSAVLVSNLTELEVECLPQDLPERIIIDISVIKEIGDSINVRDIQVADNVTIMTQKDETIVVATATREEVIVEEVAPAEEVEEPEVIEKGKKEEEEEATEEGKKTEKPHSST